MRRSIAEYRRQIRNLKKQLSFVTKKKTGPEQEPIPLFFKNENDIIDPYSAGKLSENAVLNPNIIGYLETRVDKIPKNKKAEIEIEYGGTIPDDPLLPEKLIKKELEVSITSSIKRNKKIMFDSLIHAIIGITILGFINRFPHFSQLYAFNELFVVMSWVFIWRFVDMFFFERGKIRLRMIRLFKIYTAEYRIKKPD